MNCHEVHDLLAAYQDGEVSGPERRLIREHLSTCQTCQAELESLSTLQRRLRQHLTAQADAVAPSPQAWTLLQATLPDRPPRRAVFGRRAASWLTGGLFRVGGRAVPRLALALVLLIALVLAAPPAWAMIEPIVTNWFSFTTPDGESGGAVGGFTAFTPYHATYLPENFQQSLLGGRSQPDLDSFEIGYDRGAQFIMIVQSKGPGATGLPAGDPAQVGTNPAVFLPSFAAGEQELREKRPGLSIVTSYDYSGTQLLVWFIGEVKIELLSNLPLGEMRRVAESLEPMQASQDFPP